MKEVAQAIVNDILDMAKNDTWPARHAGIAVSEHRGLITEMLLTLGSMLKAIQVEPLSINKKQDQTPEYLAELIKARHALFEMRDMLQADLVRPTDERPNPDVK